MARVCVIGGSGFLGSHVADALSASGHQVCIYDRRTSSWLRGDQEMVTGDLLDVDRLSSAISGAEYV